TAGGWSTRADIRKILSGRLSSYEGRARRRGPAGTPLRLAARRRTDRPARGPAGPARTAADDAAGRRTGAAPVRSQRRDPAGVHPAAGASAAAVRGGAP